MEVSFKTGKLIESYSLIQNIKPVSNVTMLDINITIMENKTIEQSNGEKLFTFPRSRRVNVTYFDGGTDLTTIRVGFSLNWRRGAKGKGG